CPPLSSAPTIPRPPRATLFPYTTLFRSRVVYTTNGGSTWSSEVTVDTGVSIGAFVPALQISARTYGKAWTFAYSGGTARVETMRSEEHTSELQSRENLVCRLLLEKKNSI